MANPIGIMQGRLSPRPSGRAQMFPIDTWRREFEQARDCGFDGIEWLVTTAHLDRNALLSTDGRKEIKSCADAAGIPVVSVCADVFLDRTFVRAAERDDAQALLLRLIDAGVSLQIPCVVIPILEAARPESVDEIDAMCEGLHGPLMSAASAGIRIALECDLPETDLDAVLRQLSGVQVCVDTGNLVERGDDPASEMRRLGKRVGAIHIKDRPLGGANVPLGTGAVDFPAVASAVRAHAPDVPLILETTVEADPLASARRNLSRVRAWFADGAAAS